MPTPAAKRRRFDAANETLSKPFRSPFKSPLKQPLQLNENGSFTTPKAPASNPIETAPKLNALASATFKSPTESRISTVRTSTGRQKTFISPTSAAALNADPDIAPLLVAQRQLEKQISEIKAEIDTAEQARKIEVESKKKDPDGETDSELLMLIEKWRVASRSAAEEMFGTVRDRVNKMGGPRAWKEMQKRQHEARSEWDKEGMDNTAGDGEDEVGDAEATEAEKRDLYAENDVDPETENERAQRENGIGDTGEMPGQEDEFTMAMMLRTLNVDLKIIGYDKEQQRWTD